VNAPESVEFSRDKLARVVLGDDEVDGGDEYEAFMAVSSLIV
jgi:hypothetical protein